MNKVPNLSRLGLYLMSFYGDDLAGAIKAAELWAVAHKIGLTNYFVQHRIGKSQTIIVDLQDVKDEETLI